MPGLLTPPMPERLSPLASGMGLRPFYGDLHNHCNISYGHGSLSEALKRAKRQLDFVSVTGHAYWPDMPVDDERVRFPGPEHLIGQDPLQLEISDVAGSDLCQQAVAQTGITTGVRDPVLRFVRRAQQTIVGNLCLCCARQRNEYQCNGCGNTSCHA